MVTRVYRWTRPRCVLGIALILAVCLAAILHVNAQQPIPPGVGPAPVAAPGSGPGGPLLTRQLFTQREGKTEVPVAQPMNVMTFGMMPGGPGGPAMRFTFTIDPKTPLKDLLPTPPQVKNPGRPVLTEDLTQVPEIDFQLPLPRDLNNVKAMEQTAHTMARINFLNGQKTDGFLEVLQKERTDLHGLAFAMGDECRLKGERSRSLTEAVNLVRQFLPGQGGGPGGPRMAMAVPGAGPGPQGSFGGSAPGMPAPHTGSFWDAFNAACAREKWGTSRTDRDRLEQTTVARIAALMQILAPESVELRLGLVKYLNATAHAEATRALAKLAIFSTEEEVRQAALDALKVRRERDYTSILVSGLRYPHPSVARHAADAVARLDRSDLIPQLLDVLDQPDPRSPEVQEVDGKKETVVRELVRINHHRNCLLCHSPGTTNVPASTLTAQVPVPSEPLPSPFDGYRSSSSSPDVLVRIDVTYLRQDFSLRQPVENAQPWPEMQRFDFLVRTRVVTETEAEAQRELFRKREPGVLSPYHKAALAALREMTGKDIEPTGEAWRKLLGVPRAKRTASF